MSSQELLIYIYNELALNTPRDQIMAHLMAAGWQKAEIEQAFSEVGKAKFSHTGTMTFPDLRPKRNRHIAKSIGRWIVIFLLCIVVVFTAFSILFNLGFVTSL